MTKRICFPLYHTVCEVAVDWEEGAEELLQEVKRTAQHVQKLLDFYDPESELSRLNKNYRAGVPFPVSEELYAYLKRLDWFSRTSGGLFDSTVGPLVRLWDFTAENPKVPEPGRLEQARERCGYEKIHFLEGYAVLLEQEGMEIDPGASGKGYAVDCAEALLRAENIRSGTINFGGNLYVLGMAGDRKWAVGVQQPWAGRGRTLGTLHLSDCAVATSGGYERYFRLGEKVYHHILDPRTGWPVESRFQSATAVASSAWMADLMSTLLFLGGEEAAEPFRKEDETIGFLLVDSKGNAKVSDSLKEKFVCVSESEVIDGKSDDSVASQR